MTTSDTTTEDGSDDDEPSMDDAVVDDVSEPVTPAPTEDLVVVASYPEATSTPGSAGPRTSPSTSSSPPSPTPIVIVVFVLASSAATSAAIPDVAPVPRCSAFETPCVVGIEPTDPRESRAIERTPRNAASGTGRGTKRGMVGTGRAHRMP